MALKQPLRNVLRGGASSASAPPKVKLRIQTEYGRSVLEPRADSGVAGSGRFEPLIGRADECRNESKGHSRRVDKLSNFELATHQANWTKEAPQTCHKSCVPMAMLVCFTVGDNQLHIGLGDKFN
jgi:hypothetical protein